MDVSPLSTGALASTPPPPPPPPPGPAPAAPGAATVPFSAGALAVSYEHATAGQSANTQWATYEHLAVSSSYASTGGDSVGKLADRLTSLVTRMANDDHTPSLREIEHKVAHLLRHAMRDAAASGQPFSLDLSVHVDESAAVHLSTATDGTQTDVTAAEARSFDLELHIEAGGAAVGAGPAPADGPAPTTAGSPPPAASAADGTRPHHRHGFGNDAFADLVRQLASAIQDALEKLNQPVQLTPATDSPADAPAAPPAASSATDVAA